VGQADRDQAPPSSYRLLECPYCHVRTWQVDDELPQCPALPGAAPCWHELVVLHVFEGPQR
jgi:hypothetical protein